MSFLTQVEDIVGVSISDTSALSDFLTASAREITDILPKEALLHNATIDQTTTSNAGYDAENKRILDVARDGRLSIEVPFGLSTQLASGSGSIHEPSTRSPFHYYKGKEIFIKPDPTNAQKGQVFAFAYPTVVHSGTSGIPAFPDNAEFAVILGASCKYLFRMMSDTVQAIPDVISINDLSISAVAPSAPTLSASSISFSATAPSYSKPSAVLTPTPSLSNLVIGALVPVVPTLSSSTITFDETAPAYSKPTVVLTSAPVVTGLTMTAVAPVAPTIVGGSLGTVPNAPSYVPPIISSNYGTALSSASTSIGTGDLEEANTYFSQAGNYLKEYTSTIQDRTQTFNSNLQKFQADVQKIMKSGDYITEKDKASLQKYNTEISVYSSELNSNLQEFQAEVSEKMGVYNTSVSSSIQKYSADIQNELNEFNKENAEYQAELQKSIETGRLISQDDNKKIQKYAQEIGSYSSNINKEVQEYQANLSQVIQEVSTNLQRTQVKTQALTQQYQLCESKYKAELGRLNPAKGQN